MIIMAPTFEIFDVSFLKNLFHDISSCQMIGSMLFHGTLTFLFDSLKLLKGFFLDFNTKIVTIFMLWNMKMNPITKNLTIYS